MRMRIPSSAKEMRITLQWRGKVPLCRLVYSRLTTKAAGSVPSPVGGGHQLEQQKSGCDMVGPPDPVSNIRPLKLREPTSEHEKEIQMLRLQIWAMKHHFWAQNNTQFKKEKAAYAQEVLQKNRTSGELADVDDISKVTADELSVFYKDFLDKKYNDQMVFTRGWMKLNMLLTWKQFQYRLRTLFQYTR